jgi:type II secretory pathway pseudopilin PulG
MFVRGRIILINLTSPLWEAITPKAVREAMRISEIGKNAGYTLLEILGVILLIGLMLALAQPEIFQVEEKHQVRYAGKLLLADLERVQAEVKAGNAVRIKINPNGYGFSLGENVISRDYRVNGLTFKAEGAGVVPSSTVSASANDAGVDGTAETTGGADAETELCFTPDSAGPVATIHWQSKHYQGVLTLKADNAASWDYHAK